MTRTSIRCLLALVLTLAIPFGLVAPADAKPTGKGAKTTPVDDDDLDVELDPDRELLIRNIVQSATKSVTTVEEAPTIINIITAEDIENYGYRDLLQVMGSLPSHLMTNSQNSSFPSWTVRGLTQSTLLMKDGLSLFDPVFNTIPSGHTIPLENIKRIEVMTNPGGVLWGANSFVGITNIITKDAEDVNGLEVALGFSGIPGGGYKGGPCYPGKTTWYCSPGDQETIRPYLMYGKTFFGGRLKVFSHLSTEFTRGPIYETIGLTSFSPPPRLNSPSRFSASELHSVMPVSMIGQWDGKISLVKPGTSRSLVLGWQWQFQGLHDGHARPVNFLFGPSDWREKRGNNLGAGFTNWQNSFVYLQYRDRFLKDKMGLNTRLFYNHFDRNFHVVVFPYQDGLVEGVAFRHNSMAERAGGTIDMDFQLHRTLKLLVGGEVFYEWLNNAEAWFTDPTDDLGQLRFSRLSVICPYYDRNGDGVPIYDPTDPNRTNFVPGCRQPYIFDSDRLVTAGFVSASWKPISRLSLDAGIRVQGAPAGNVGYDPVLLYSGAAVFRVFEEIYLKANYSTGFRSPIFNNTSGNPAMPIYSGNPKIKSETSQGISTEIYAKLAKNKGQVREWNVRLNYAYTEIKDRIVILTGTYENAADTSAVHSVEFLSKLYLKGGHAFDVAYTYFTSWGPNQVNGGFFRSIPNHWFAMSGVFNLFRKGNWQLDLNTSLRVMGSFEDPNRVPSATGGASASNVAFDRISPQAFWNFGARMRVKLGERPFELKANFYNLLNQRSYNIDPNFALSPRTEQLPVPLQRFHFFVQAKFTI